MRALVVLTLLFVAPAAVLGCGEVVEVLGPASNQGEGGALVSGAGSGAAGDAGDRAVSGAGGESGGAASGAGGDDPLGGAGGVPSRPDVVRLDAGSYHVCAVLDGALYCWGQNQRGRLGLGDTENRLLPARVGSDSDWSEVTAGSEHSCALKMDGSVYCFGVNDDGQIGVAGVNDVLSPLRVELPRPASSLSAEADFTCALLDDGALYCWGENVEGQLGQNDEYPGDDAPLPLRVTDFGDYLAVDTGQGHACALRSPGTPYCWGRNTASELGLGAGAPGQTRFPGLVVDATDFMSIQAGQHHSCAVRAPGSLWCWGGNTHANLGTGDRNQRDVPTTIIADGISAVSLDTFHTCALAADQSLSCWGRNAEGQLGVGDAVDRLTPAAVAGHVFEQVSAGRFFTCALDTDHVILCTGANESGQLGFGDTERRADFEPLSYPFE